MKKTIQSIIGFSALLILAASIASCKINDVTTEDKGPPAVVYDAESKSATISFHSYDDMKYANVIRLKCGDKKFSGSVSKENIGQIVPSNINKLSETYQFKDSNLEAGYFYRYLIRYYTGSKYIYTKSNKNSIEGETTEAFISAATVDLNHVRNDADLVYSLQLDPSGTDLIVPENFTEVDFIISNGEKTRPFKLGDTKDDSGTWKLIAASTPAVDLQKILSKEFLDNLTTIEGIIAIKKEIFLTGDLTYTSYYWSQKFDGASFTVTTFDKDGNAGNYTDANGLPQTADKVLWIPSLKNPDNHFDFSTPNLSIK